MKRRMLLAALVSLAVLVPVSQAAAFNFRISLRRARWQTRNRVAAILVQRPNRAVAAGPETRQEGVSSRHYRSLDEKRCAELGPDRARMVYPKYDDTDPYPACKAWKWNDEDGWGWDWSEMNCPWKQLRHPLRYNYD